MAKRYIALKKQIGEIQEIKDITDVLEKVAAANVHYLANTNKIMEQYEMMLGKIFSDFTQDNIQHPFLNHQPKGKMLSIILTAEKSLCGGLFNNLIDDFIAHYDKEDILVIGQAGRRILEERSIPVNYFFPAINDIPQEKDIRLIKKLILGWYLKGKYKGIIIYYPEFTSLDIQHPKSLIFLPFTKSQFIHYLQSKSPNLKMNYPVKQDNYHVIGYPIYEPSSKQLLDYLMKQYLGMFFYQKVLETKLSELSARTVAMGEAGERAKELASHMKHQYFKIKRAAVTKAINDLYEHRLKKHTIYEQINE